MLPFYAVSQGGERMAFDDFFDADQWAERKAGSLYRNRDGLCLADYEFQQFDSEYEATKQAWEDSSDD